MREQRRYIAIDLKSFYASVECIERGINPLDACLVVADESRTEKTICLAVSPALKAYGLPGRPRLFEVVQKVREVNRRRGRAGRSTSGRELAERSDLALDYIVATPRMQLYIDYSTRIYGIYMRYIAPEDIHVYSIDEVFIDATAYLDTYKMTAHELVLAMIRDVTAETGIVATAGIGTNMYLCKIAMDIVAKKMAPDKDGVRIAELDEMSYRRQLWDHTPLTDFWRLGRGYARKLEAAGLHTMGDIASASLTREDWFYDQFGVNAELLIDHAWGWEPVTMEHVKAYRPDTRSMSSGQVLSEAYTYEKALTVIQEMADEVALELVDKGLVTDQIVLTVGYDSGSLTDQRISSRYDGRVSTDYYGRKVPYHAHGTSNFERYTSSSQLIIKRVTELFERIVNPVLLVRRLTLSINRIIPEHRMPKPQQAIQLELFTDYEALELQRQAEKEELDKERRRQEAVLKLRKRFGKNIILRGLNYADGATQRERNQQIGGHKK
ncbi:MAG: DNA methylase [Muribaculaceae bacterium]|nr:DNA methylase [Muribaculaceae bacterium]